MISKWHTDNVFNKSDVEEDISPAKLDAYARNEHFGSIEMSIRKIKEPSQRT